MPILLQEPDLYPVDLLEREDSNVACEQQWYAMYTRSRCEKQLMRALVNLEIPFYGPTIPRRYRSPSGRLRVCHDLLFRNYVFVYGDEYQRFSAESTKCVSRCLHVENGQLLRDNLRCLQRLIEIGRPLTPESRLLPGDRVKVRSGVFAGFEGVVIRREHKNRLQVAVEFMLQGASVQLDDCQLENIT